MQYSIVNGIKTAASPGLIGICECCNAPTFSACGNLIQWHWKHKSLKNCDSWWENETQWHRDWKEKFLPEYREVICYDDVTNEKHIADIKTKNGIVIEFQNSPLDINELQSRESFYEKLIWVINAEKFKDNIEISFKLPDLRSPFPNEIDFADSKHFLTYNKNKYADGTMEFSSSETQKHRTLVEEHYSNMHRLVWKYKRKVWLEAKAPLFLDFGDDKIWRVQQIDRFENFRVISHYDKKNFIDKYK